MTAAGLILYVDDEVANRVVFEQTIAGELAVRVVADGAAALAVLETTEVAVLVTDMRMPQMSGDQLLRIVKQRWPATIRMVMTAYSAVDPILTAINEGLVARYVVKPWQADELVQTLRWGVEAWAFGKESSALQRRLLETERLTTLGSMAGAVVHDLNQPLASMVINTERLLELAGATAAVRRLVSGARLGVDDRATVEELVDELGEIALDLRTSAYHLRDVTAGLGRFLSARTVGTVDDVATAPLPVIRHALAVCHDIAVRAQGFLHYQGPETLPDVRCTGAELAQVLINLVANGAQAILRRAVADAQVVVAASVEPSRLVLEVRDEGGGMTPAVLAQVGTPFFTTRDGGVGLGVAQCQRLVGKWGGAIRYASEPGQGTVVTVAIPLA